MQVLFWGSLIALVYVYAGYPLLIWLYSRMFPRPVHKGDCRPEVTVIIPAYNEEHCIRTTLENKLALDYPIEKMEILVVSDGSTDQTDDIVRSYADRGVRLVRQEPRAGKTAGLNLAVPEAQGEIIMFSDANSLHDPGALKALVANFSDPKVGYVTGKMIYVHEDGSLVGDGCSTYMKYENLMRQWETGVGSVVGVDGGVDAVRKCLYRPMNPDQLPDFVLPLTVANQGFRVVYEPKALLKEETLKEARDEYRMRVRVSLRALWALHDMRRLFLPGKDLLYSWQLWSHKILRYLAFFFMIGALVANCALVGQGSVYTLSLIVQLTGYAAAGLAFSVNRQWPGYRLLYLAQYFLLLNTACAHAFYEYVRGRKMVLWIPRKG